MRRNLKRYMSERDLKIEGLASTSPMNNLRSTGHDAASPQLLKLRWLENNVPHMSYNPAAQ